MILTASRRIDKLPATGQYVLDQFKAQTTWVGSLFMGGPNPETGKLTTLTVHTGKTLNLNNEFPKATALWKDVESAWERYVTACFAPDTAEKLHEAYHKLTPEADRLISSSPSTTSSPSPPPPDGSASNSSNAKKRKRAKRKESPTSPSP
ncbi:hypothetical protein OH76DRAFT_1489995 [Lentinus brumalis]|uniref:Uncharacterized protein n=1 Tax=Lentinus brumalis TaxID=2498619 RepID=A0A371CKI1_9APHY|nr:hypothetical protein OH76DRAFT_1489995 [Polyporus brumalis]